MLKKTIVLIAFLGFSISGFAQDTLRVMTYNLLYYGQPTDFCTFSNNNPNLKEGYLRTILAHDLPDIFVVCEISSNTLYHQRILDSVFLKISGQPYARAVSQNISNSNIMNMMYYNSAKVALYSQRIIQSLVRDINLYSFYYKSPDLANGDTAFLHCIGAHLKAGSSSSDIQSRRNQVNNVIAWLQTNSQPGNYLFMGDLNVSSSEELAMQALLFGSDPRFRFYDPVNQLGNWSSNSGFAAWHTQSTHISGACHSGGGLDDRFDFILASADIMDGNNKMKYVENSYRTLGQDGLRYNKALLDSPFNASAPFPVLEALYHNSDHLPVLLSLAVNQTASGIAQFAENEFSYNNPVNDILTIAHNGFQPGSQIVINIYAPDGSMLHTMKDHTGNHSVQVDISFLPRGFYLVEIRMEDKSKVLKVVRL